MKTYEMVREIPNLCANNQMRDVFFDEVETDDPVAYVKSILKGKSVELTTDFPAPGRIHGYPNIAGMVQKFRSTAVLDFSPEIHIFPWRNLVFQLNIC